MPQEGLTIIVQTRALDRVHYALMLAAANAAVGAPTAIFFGIEGVHALGGGGFDGLRTAAGEVSADYLKRVSASGGASPDDLLTALAELEVWIAACDTGLAVAEMSPADLRSDIAIDVTGLTDVLSKSDGRLIYV
mgnify:CR=1 FL=1|jgi:peroxiredoxin family protein